MIALAAASAVLLAAIPASAAADAGMPAEKQTGGDWERVPSAPFDQAAGVTCDFPVHGEPIVDLVVRMVLQTYPDGSVKREMYTGALIIRITNTTTGASVDKDASGTAVVDYKPGGSYSSNSTWHAEGPILLGMRADGGNLPRALYIVNGIYTLNFSKSGYRTVKWKVDGGADNICDDL
ncbi:MAG: hypothetical protein KJO75_09440 [Dactylosporangium sp.]|nr:hypothetical protein [Dactylosporangium sp.]